MTTNRTSCLTKARRIASGSRSAGGVNLRKPSGRTQLAEQPGALRHASQTRGRTETERGAELCPIDSLTASRHEVKLLRARVNEPRERPGAGVVTSTFHRRDRGL